MFTPPGWDLPESPFHAGELAIQERVGVREKIDAQGRRAVRRFLPEQHRAFYASLPHLFVGSVDTDGQPWASMLMGEPGFMSTPDEVSLRVRARPLFGDPLGRNLREGAEVAAVGVELPTRRRNRVIGTARDVGPDGFTITVRQTMGVCPQYIQGRHVEFTADPMQPAPRPVHEGDRLDEAALGIIARADTYFVASVNPRAEDGVASGADISHRGGRRGFVRADDDRTLTAPDFVGNFIFNTLGNFQIDPRAGLLFVDFENGDMLYVAATADVIWDGLELRAFAGAQRLVRYRVQRVIRVEGGLPARFTPPEDSPLLARTGSWDEVARTLEAERLRGQWRGFRIVRVEAESSVIRSFYLEPADGFGLASYEAGQFLPVRATVPGREALVVRSYTLSDAPGGQFYRVSVKREGSCGFSDWLHDHAKVGTLLEAMSPRGGFTFDGEARRPAVLISAGVGITPMIAMLNSLLVNEGRTRFHQKLFFVHGARNSQEHAFAAHLREKAEKHGNLSVHVRYSDPAPGDALGTTHDSEGRIDIALIKSLLALDDYEFYLCGPQAFMQSLYDELRAIGVRDPRIHFESFGPASVRRMADAPEAGEGVEVRFARSGKTAIWHKRAGTLLDLAERTGLAPLSACRSGVCGTCATRVLSGQVTYEEEPAHEVAAGDALICCAAPVGARVSLDL
jgi:ferredoxin-NADP reductase/predicted pyridoxine 5'-phosphate oxidase superfamily flavin-nucleotide-binding protein